MRVLAEYWDEGGRIRWIAQTAPEHRDPLTLIARLARAGASAAFVHGGEVDRLIATGRLDTVRAQLDAIRASGLPGGAAAHCPEHHRALRDAGVALDFHLVCLYRVEGYRGDSSREPVESFDPAHRQAAIALLSELAAPVLVYKVYAAGRFTDAGALDHVMQALSPRQGVVIGMFPPDRDNIVGENVARVLRGGHERIV